MDPWHNLEPADERRQLERLHVACPPEPRLRPASTMVQARALTCYAGARLVRAIDQGRRPPAERSWLDLGDDLICLDGTFATLSRASARLTLSTATVGEYVWLVSRYAGDALGGDRVAEHVEEVLYRLAPSPRERAAIAEVVHAARVEPSDGGWRVVTTATAPGEVVRLVLEVSEQGALEVRGREVVLEAPSVCAVRTLF